MREMSDLDLLAVQAKTDRRSRENVLLSMRPLVGWLASKYRRRLLEQEDLFQVGWVGVNDAINDYEPSVAGFRSYATKRAKWKIFAELHKYTRPHRGMEREYVGMMDFEGDGHCPWASRSADQEVYARAHELIRKAKDNQQQTVLLGMLSGHSYEEIGAQMGVTRARVEQVVRAIENENPHT